MYWYRCLQLYNHSFTTFPDSGFHALSFYSYSSPLFAFIYVIVAMQFLHSFDNNNNNNNNETPTVRGLAADKNKLYTETMILWNNHYNLNYNV